MEVLIRFYWEGESPDEPKEERIGSAGASPSQELRPPWSFALPDALCKSQLLSIYSARFAVPDLRASITEAVE